MLNNLRHLEYVVAVSRKGGLAEASAELNVSQSAVSAAIRACEAEVGYDIFVRRPAKRLQLTALGAEFIRNALIFLEQASAFAHSSKGLKESDSGEISISCFSSFSSHFMPALMEKLRKSHPGLTLDIYEDDHPAIVEKLRSGKVEIGITYDIVRNKDIAFWPLLSARPTALLATQHPLANRPRVSLTDLQSEEMLCLRMPLISEYVLGLFAANGLRPPILRTVSTIALLREMVRRRLGFSIGFFPTPPEEDMSGGIRFVDISEAVATHNLVVATYRPMTTTRRAKAVIAACEQLVRDPRCLWHHAD